MELALRRSYYGLGDSGEVDVEGVGLPGGLIDTSSGEFDPSAVFAGPGFNIGTTPGVDLTPAELATEQSAARDWIAHSFDPTNVSKIAQAVATGALVASHGLNAAGHPICTSGYAYPNGQCAQVSGQLVPGVSNQTLAIVGGVVLVLLLAGGRRR